MEYFKKYFNDIEERNWLDEEVKVCCPFHNDNKPSASINTSKNLFHCWVCNIGYNEEQFIAKINNIPTTEAIKLLDKYNIHNDWDVNKGLLWSDENFLNKVRSLGLSDETINSLNLGLVKFNNSNKRLLGIPVFYNNILVDVRKYNLLKYEGLPKCSSNDDAESGWIIPYDTFLESDEVCYLFEGEKDMLIAREQGINAYTLTCGAGAIPNSKIIGSFKNKDIVLCYDNDEAGQKGMINVFKCIKDIAKDVKYIKIGDVVKKEKEDFYDYITLYNGDIFEFYSLDQHHFNLYEIEKNIRITIKEALNENRLRKKLKSIITVTSEFQDPYSVPTVVEFEKVDEKGSKNETMISGEKRNWFLEEKNLIQMLELIEVNAKDNEIKSKLKNYVGIPNTEPFVEVRMKEPKTVYKTTVVDKDIDGSVQSLDLYSFERLDVGGQYVIDYKIYPHPTKHQKLVAICINCIPIHDNRNYTINKDILKMFQHEGTIEERLNYLYH